VGGLRTLGRRRTRTPTGHLRRGARKKGLSETLQAEVLSELDRLLGRSLVRAADFEALEAAARRAALSVAARFLRDRLDADTSDHKGPHLPCPCGHDTRYAGRRPKTFESALGPLTLTRAYYHCPACQHGFCPRDRELGLEGGSLTPAVLRMVGAVGALVSFDEGSQLLHELAGVSVSPRQVERDAERLGEEIANDERTLTEPLGGQEVQGTAYLGLDGTGIPMRKEELQGRAGKQSDGSSRTREVKLVSAWTANQVDDDGHPVRDPGSITYSAAIESAATKDTDTPLSAFAQRVEREAQRRDFDHAQRQVVLGDGAVWIWNLTSELFPDAIQIVDKWHAKEHLSEVSKDIFGAQSPQARTWVAARYEELDTGRFDDLLAAVAVRAEDSEEARKCVGYLTTNRARMDYPAFEAQGLCTGSGVVEAGCKTAIGTRLKRAGMHWSVRGANAIIALRCCRLSGRFEDFWERRCQAA